MYKLLIVDDSTRERTSISKLKIWRELGFDEVHTAVNGQDGYKKALEINPVMIISDVSMPVMDGLDMAKNILKSIPDAKFIFMSCFDDSEYIREAIDLNAFAYILKPINIEKLRKTVIKILNIKETEQNRENKLEEMKCQIKKNTPIIREQFIRDWFYGNISSGKYGDFAELQLDIRKYYALAALQVDDFDGIAQNDDYKEKYLTLNLIVSLLNNPELADFRCVSFIHAKNEIGIMLYIDNVDNIDEATNVSVDFFEYIKSEIIEQLDISVSIYVGGVSDVYEAVPHFFEVTDKFIKDGICQKDGSIVFVSESDIEQSSANYNISSLKDEILAIIEDGDDKKIEDFAKKYISEDNMKSVFAVKRFMYMIVTILQFTFCEMGENFNDVLNDEFLKMEKIAKHNTIREARNILTNILRFSGQYLRDTKSGRDQMLVNHIKKIVSEQWETLKNVEQIASQTYFSAVHANVIFKKNMGCTIFDYLTRYKIEQAKNMLLSGKYKVYEVSERLGYKSKNYFSSLFKEYTGETPGHWCVSNKKEKE